MTDIDTLRATLGDKAVRVEQIGGQVEQSPMPNKLPSAEFLRKLLRYDPETGRLFWLERARCYFREERSMNAWNAKHAEGEAFTADDGNGYKRGKISGRHYLAHRVAYAIYYGAWPSGDIDHINGIREDNRIQNLRCVSRSENAKNQKLRRNSKTGAVGVHWNGLIEKWVARATTNGKCIHIGVYSCKTSAVLARKLFEKNNGFHENHGRL